MSDEAGPDDHSATDGMDVAAEVKTPFAANEDVDSMKDMVIDAKPELVFDVADTWKTIHDALVSGGGSVKEDFDKTVDHVLQHWEGEAADEFAKKAKKLSRQISEGAAYAGYISVAMRNAGERLNEIKPQIDAIGKPDRPAGARNLLGIGSSPDGGKWRDGIQGAGHGTQDVNTAGKDLAGRKDQLKAAALMERLAMTYSSQTIVMGSWRRPSGNQDQPDYPGHPGGVTPVPEDVTPQGGAGAVPPGGGVTGGIAVGRSAATSTSRATPLPKATPGSKSQGAAGTASAASMNVDGISGGTATGPRPGGANGGAPAGGISGRGVPAGPTPGAAGRVPGGLGSAGQGARSRETTGKDAGARKDVAANGGDGRRAPDGGVPGARVPGGIGADQGTMGGLGARDRGKGGASGGGPTVPRSGGAPDSPLWGRSPSRQSGQGLHFSRGGGTPGVRGRIGNGARGVGLGGDQTDSGPTKYDRGDAEPPDYFVEDEGV